MIETTQVVKSQSASGAPEIATVPRSFVQVADGEPTDGGQVSVSASSSALEVSEEEEKDEDAESGHSDDEEDMDDERLPTHRHVQVSLGNTPE